jgi:hypothetical protein
METKIISGAYGATGQQPDSRKPTARVKKTAKCKGIKGLSVKK